MYRWLNQSHPQTLQGAVLLGYLIGVFSLLGGTGALGLLIALAIVGGAFGTANSKRVGYYALAVASSIYFLLFALILVFQSTSGGLTNILIDRMLTIRTMIFPGALVAAVLHAHSRQYQKIWFE